MQLTTMEMLCNLSLASFTTQFAPKNGVKSLKTEASPNIISTIKQNHYFPIADVNKHMIEYTIRLINVDITGFMIDIIDKIGGICII